MKIGWDLILFKQSTRGKDEKKMNWEREYFKGRNEMKI